MNEVDITIRKAVAKDANLIADAIVMAIGDDMAIQYCGDNYKSVIPEIVIAEDTQFSYRNALVAEINGATVGAIIGYDGTSLKRLKANTFNVINRYSPCRMNYEVETGAGEFYIDSIGVLPGFRKLGVGRKLLMAMVSNAFFAGHKTVGLSVDPDNPKAEKLYISFGFKFVGEQLFLGHKLKHLQISMPQIRKTEISDIPTVMKIYDAARAFMRSSGNLHQWTDGYPSETQLRSDIDAGGSYVLVDENDKAIATFFFTMNGEPTYQVIRNGHWLDCI